MSENASDISDIASNSGLTTKAKVSIPPVSHTETVLSETEINTSSASQPGKDLSKAEILTWDVNDNGDFDVNQLPDENFSDDDDKDSFNNEDDGSFCGFSDDDDEGYYYDLNTGETYKIGPFNQSFYTGTANTSFSSVGSTRRTSISVSTSASSVATADSTDAVPRRMPDCNYYRNLWWDKGEFNEKAKWEEVALPYVLATGITIEEYEQRTEKFSIHGCWEWSNREVIIYEFPSTPHEVCIVAVVKMIIKSCGNADGTNAEILGFGSTRTRDINRGKEADASFRPEKPAVTLPNGSDRNNFPWPNLVIEVAYTETLDHVEEALRYWLSPGRAHDCIIVKIDPVPQGQDRLGITVSQQRDRSKVGF
ncbi:13668_t:CDS:10 [Ambispora gerdemannii]|uniref:13668_t:CDS:1 n=1 Tax=Ambispora gerdemannii TaxID=144530 RepID=A0A9N9GGB5_9GLOM|nr:13668_t:CDS:10 [Ambispora gerdemannii]